MARTRRWRSLAGLLALTGGVFLATGSAAYAGPTPAPEDLELRLVVDCPDDIGAAQP